jgi:hypothetical protein
MVDPANPRHGANARRGKKSDADRVRARALFSLRRQSQISGARFGGLLFAFALFSGREMPR